MDSNHDLGSVIATLRDAERHGWLSDLQVDVAEANRGPADDLDRFPGYRFEIERLAKIASRLLGDPLPMCRAAAADVLLPTTRRTRALAVIEDYRQRIDHLEAHKKSQHEVAAANRRLRRA